mmetsp:Transcript_25270/g.59600  ORF Transcript_25270/g.59600 Transcript_25270/m.59600 type:complete len:344 (+) Transcript_25270:23-1054(+)
MNRVRCALLLLALLATSDAFDNKPSLKRLSKSFKNMMNQIQTLQKRTTAEALNPRARPALETDALAPRATSQQCIEKGIEVTAKILEACLTVQDPFDSWSPTCPTSSVSTNNQAGACCITSLTCASGLTCSHSRCTETCSATSTSCSNGGHCNTCEGKCEYESAECGTEDFCETCPLYSGPAPSSTQVASYGCPSNTDFASRLGTWCASECRKVTFEMMREFKDMNCFENDGCHNEGENADNMLNTACEKGPSGRYCMDLFMSSTGGGPSCATMTNDWGCCGGSMLNFVHDATEKAEIQQYFTNCSYSPTACTCTGECGAAGVVQASTAAILLLATALVATLL